MSESIVVMHRPPLKRVDLGKRYDKAEALLLEPCATPAEQDRIWQHVTQISHSSGGKTE